MRAALIVTMILLIPAALFAGPTMGVYFGTKMTYSPLPMTHFTGYVWSEAVDCYLTGADYALQVPYDELNGGVFVQTYSGPYGDLVLGTLPTGVSMAFFPPLPPGFNIITTIDFFADNGCYPGGTMQDWPLRVIGHPETGEIRGICFPENEIFTYVGLTSIICPELVGVQETNWGAIKSLF